MNAPSQHPSDPRIRRTRNLLQDALQSLLDTKPFTDISITDICKQADIARVTFYQHYDSKEALLLAAVSDFFTNFHETINVDAITHYLKTGELDPKLPVQPSDLADPERIKLVGVALAHIGSAVRNLSIASFKTALATHEKELNEKELDMLSAFYIGGIFTMMEQLLNGQLSLSVAEFQAATLPLLRALRQGMLESRDTL